jgi:predicted O-methyltransferase YrrM
MSAIEEFSEVTPYQQYIRRHFHQDDDTLARLQREAVDAGIPAISIGPEQGRFMQMMVQLTGARKVLEIGTLGGYSGAWMGRALPAEGKLISLELNPKHADFTRKQWAAMDLPPRMEVRVGPALESLPKLAEEAPFDVVFIDADKESYPDYLEWAIRYSRPGTVILADNVEMGGSLLEPAHQESAGIRGMHRFVAALSNHPQLESTVVPYADGLAVAIVKE